MSSRYDGLAFVSVYLCLGDLNKQNIYDKRQKKFKSMIVSMLQCDAPKPRCPLTTHQLEEYS